MKNRREFLKDSAKIAGGLVAGASVLGANPLFATSQNTKNAGQIFGLQEALDGKAIPARGYAAYSKEWKFKPFSFTRHPLGENDILIEILYAGICHSDLHQVSGDFGDSIYPIVPGHEIAGVVVAVGKKVRKFKVGDFAGVGCMVNSCGECAACKESEEQFCERGQTVYTYNSKDIFHAGQNTYGGYSNNIVLSENFALKVPKNADLSRVAPLLCAGITTYSPIQYSKVKKNQKVAVAGLGGLGHMAAKYMIALGAKVSAFDIVDKSKEAKELGIAEFIDAKDGAKMQSIQNEFDFIISTIPYHYDINIYHKMLKRGGEMAIVGLPSQKDNPSLNANAMIWQVGRKIYSSLIGGIKQTQEMLDYSVKNNIYPDIELIPIQKLDEAYVNVAAGKVKFRYVIDMNSLKA